MFWKRTQICYILLFPKRNWKNVSDLMLMQSGNDRCRKIAVTIPLLMHREISPREPAVWNTKNMTTQTLDFSRKHTDVQRFYASLGKRTAAMMLSRMTIISIAKASTNACQKRTAMVPGTNSASPLMTKLTLRPQTDVSAQKITLLLRMNK